jgi:hypothetical protein
VNPVTTIVNRIVTEAYLGLVKADLDIPEIDTQWNAPGVDAMKFVAGWAMALVTVALVAGGVVSIAALAGSKVLSSGQRTLAIGGLVTCFGCAIVLGSITALLAFGGTIKLV